MFPKQDYSSMVTYYGPVGENQTKLILPYPMRLSWDLNYTVKRITCHNKVADSLVKCLTKIYDLYDRDFKIIQSKGLDLFGGCLNVRKIRGGNSWSIHSWGTAIDLDPVNNKLKWGRDKAKMPEEVIDIFVDEGWVSLGRSKNFDYMHFQAANL